MGVECADIRLLDPVSKVVLAAPGQFCKESQMQICVTRVPSSLARCAQTEKGVEEIRADRWQRLLHLNSRRIGNDKMAQGTGFGRQMMVLPYIGNKYAAINSHAPEDDLVLRK